MHNKENGYYAKGGIEAIDVIDAFELNFNLGNTIKYVLRAGGKSEETRLIDLKKALDYLQHEIDKEEAKHIDPTSGE